MTNYFKTVFRQATKNPLYAVINLFGLSAGIASCIIIFLFAANEFKYDKFHQHTEKIYRVTAYRINISWWIFFAAGALALLIALLTVSFQAIKAAIGNPVKSLRTE